MDHSAAAGLEQTAGLESRNQWGNPTKLVAEARVETERSSRYLIQRCRHVHKAGRAYPQMQAHVEWSDDRGMISFDWGRCTLGALPGVLTLQAEAPDEDTLRRLEHSVGDHLERIGRRDRLRVTWTLPESAGEETAEHPADGTADPTGLHMTVMGEDPDNHARQGGHARD